MTKKEEVTTITTLADDIVDNRHYIVNNQPECLSFWELTTRLNQIKASQLVNLLRLNIDCATETKCGGTCTKIVYSNSYTSRKPAKRTVKADYCEDDCIINIKRII